MKYAKTLAFYVLDVFAVIYVLDQLTLTLVTKLLGVMLNFALSCNRWRLFRSIVLLYCAYRSGLFLWRRYRIRTRLTDKTEELLDKHSRMLTKLSATESPAIDVDTVGMLSLPALRTQLLSKKITAVDLIDACQRRALDIFRRRPGCIAEIIFDADVYAILADSKLSVENPKDLSPLHGIPVGVEEVFPVRGYDHTMGYVSQTRKPSAEDCALVAALKNAGAVPFVLTNFRQKIIGLTSENPIFGLTHHPTHEHRACVSGDAVLLAHRGVVLSFAVDILGDARLTAAFCGMVGFKPTTSRMSQRGLNMPIKVSGILGAVASPIGHTTSDVVDSLRSLWTRAMFSEDALLCPLKFDEKKYTRGSTDRLIVGFYTGFSGLIHASPAVERVMHETKRFLESKGHKVVEFVPPDPRKAYQLVMSILLSTVAPETLKLVYGDGHGDIMVDYKQRLLHVLHALPKFLRKLVCHSRAARIRSAYPVASLALHGFARSEPLTKLEYEAQQYAQSFFDAWNENQLDCILCPVSPIPAPWDYSPFYVVNCVFVFTAMYNLLGCPAGTVNVGCVEKSDINLSEATETTDPNYQNLLMFAKQMHASEGLPINVQVVAKPWEDELALGLMQTIEMEMGQNLTFDEI